MNQVQTLRSSVAGTRPTGRPPGELFTNWPDKQIGVVDAANQPMDLVAVRYFSDAANYPIGEFVVEAGDIWRAIVAVTPAPFDPTQWASLSAVGSPPDLSVYVLKAGDTMTGALTLAADAAAPLEAVPYQQLAGYAEWAGGDFTGPINGTSASFSGGVQSSPGFNADDAAGIAKGYGFSTANVTRWFIASDATPESGANAGSNFAINAFNDAGAGLGSPLEIDRATGATTFKGMTNSSVTLSAPLSSLNLLYGNVNNLNRWVVVLGDGSAESGGNAGSDFQLNAYSDTGAFLSQPMNISRATGVVNFAQQPTVNGIPILRDELQALRDQIAALRDELAALKPQPKGAR